MLKYKADIRTLLFILIITMLRICLWIWGTGAMFFLIPFVGWLVFSFLTIKHNHFHNHIFRNKKLNTLMNYVLDITTGTASTGMIVIHLINHHQENNSIKDWGSTHHLKFKNPFIRLIVYPFGFMKKIILNKNKFLKETNRDQMRKDELKENTIIFIVYGILLFISPFNTIYFILLPNFIGQFILIGFNFLQHDGCDENSEYNHSVNYTGEIINWFAFNTGYHTIHHDFPLLHWSLTPGKHDELIVPNIDKRLIHTNCITTILMDYLLNRPKERKKENNNQ